MLMTKTQATTLERFSTPHRDDLRWSNATIIVKDCFVIVESEDYRIFPTKIVNGKKSSIPLRVYFCKIHVLCTRSMTTRTFKVYLHQGKFYYDDSGNYDRRMASKSPPKKDRETLVDSMRRFMNISAAEARTRLGEWSDGN